MIIKHYFTNFMPRVGHACTASSFIVLKIERKFMRSVLWTRPHWVSSFWKGNIKTIYGLTVFFLHLISSHPCPAVNGSFTRNDSSLKTLLWVQYHLFQVPAGDMLVNVLNHAILDLVVKMSERLSVNRL